MDKLISKALELKSELDSLPLFIEYKRVKDLYLNSEELHHYQKMMVRCKNENRMEDYLEVKKEYENHPLYVEFHDLETEVVTYLEEITNILNKK